MVPPSADYVQIRRSELAQILKELTVTLVLLDSLAKERPIIYMMKARLEQLLYPLEEEKTPVRPASTDALRAFTLSTDFNPGKK